MRSLFLALALMCGVASASYMWLGNQEDLPWGMTQQDKETWGLWDRRHLTGEEGEGLAGMKRSLLEASSFVQVLATDSSGARILQGTVVAQGVATDPFCQTEAYICFKTVVCRRIRRRSLLQNTATTPEAATNLQCPVVAITGILAEAYPGVTFTSVTFDPATGSITAVGVATGGTAVNIACSGTTCTASCPGGCPSGIPTAPQTLPAIPTGSNPSSTPTSRRRSLLAAEALTEVQYAQGETGPTASSVNGFTYTQNIVFKGSLSGSQAGTNAVAQAFNTGELNLCDGYSFTGGSSQPTVDPIKPVQRYVAQVSIATRGPGCSTWEKNKGRRAYSQCTASITGQPNAFTSASCATFGRGGARKKRRVLTITVTAARSATAAQGQELLNGLVASIGDGSFWKCLQAQGLMRFRPTGVRGAALDIPKPRLPT